MNLYFVIIIFTILFSYFLETITDYLNLKNLKTTLPDEFKDYYDTEKYQKSQEYTIDNTKFSLFSSTFNLIITISFILLGGFNYIDLFAISFGYGEIVTGLIFTGLLGFSATIINLPFSVYSTFVIEEKYGFNKTTVKTFLGDLIKGTILSVVLGALVLSGIFWFFESTGNFAWLYCWLALSVFQIFIMFFAPIFIMPLFNKFEPLSDLKLKEQIDYYAKEQNFQLNGIFTTDGSKRSTKLNAYFTGFGKYRRIVFFDTLLEKLNSKEIISVLAHEMGHYKLKHIFKMIIASLLTTGFMFFVLSLFINNKNLFLAFKMDNLSVYASLIFFGFLYSPISMILSIFNNMMSRKHEFEADEYSVKTTKQKEEMTTALKKLSVESLSNLNPHWLNVFLNYSHPPVTDRIKAISKIRI